MFQRKIVEIIAARMWEDDNRPIQVVAGPRQTGKSTAIAQALEKVDKPANSASADDVIAPDVEWLRTEWQQARNLQRDSDRPAILVCSTRCRRCADGPTWRRGSGTPINAKGAP